MKTHGQDCVGYLFTGLTSRLHPSYFGSTKSQHLPVRVRLLKRMSPQFRTKHLWPNVIRCLQLPLSHTLRYGRTLQQAFPLDRGSHRRDVTVPGSLLISPGSRPRNG